MKTCLAPIEYQLKSDDQLCFIHIPKTAGSSLISVLDANFHVDQIRAPSSPDIVQQQWQHLAHVKLFRGHFTYAEVVQALPQTPLFLTVLRSPLNRTQSLYKYCKTLPPQAKNRDRLMAAAAGSFRDFVFHPDPLIRDLISNGQTLQLASDARHQPPDQILAIAKQRLDQCLFVGLTEQFQLSMLLLCYILGWYPNLDAQSLRVSPHQIRQHDLDCDLQAAIADVNQLDNELYCHAQRWFGDRITQMVAALTQAGSSHQAEPSGWAQLDLAQLADQRYQQRHAENPIQRVQHIDFDCAQPISGKGWHRRNGRENGLILDSPLFRWTGPDLVSTIDWSLSATADLIIRLHVVNAAADDVLNSLALTVNHYPIPLEKLWHRNKNAVFVGHIPQATLPRSGPFTRLRLTVNRTLPLHQVHADSTDSRLVGIALSRIQVFPATALPGQAHYLPLRFPVDDLHWVEPAQFIKLHQHRYTQLAAPEEFLEVIPRQIYCQESISLAAVGDRTQTTGLIVHKGRLDYLDDGVLDYAIRQFDLVFANAVFLIFISPSDLPKIPYGSPHVRSLWRRFYLPCFRRQLRQLLHFNPQI